MKCYARWAALWGCILGGCYTYVPCKSSADCVSESAICDPVGKYCVQKVEGGGDGGGDAGADAGVDGGPPAVLCGDQGCPAWQTCKPTGPARGECADVVIQPVAPGEGQVVAGTARTVFKFQVTQWDGGVLERDSIPVLAMDGGISGPTTLRRVGNAFQEEFVPANVLGRQSVTAGWPAVNSTISVNTEQCNVSCAQWQECRPTKDGGTCASLDVQLSFVQPVDVTVGLNAPVTIQAHVWRTVGGALPESVPFRTANGLKGVLGGSSFTTTIDGGSQGGDIAIILGWEDGGTVVSGKYTVDLTPPSLSVTAAPAPVYPGDAGNFFPNDTTPAWRKDETIDVTVTSGSADIDPSSVVVTARHAGEPALTLVGTPTDCGGTYCKVFKLDLSQVQMNAFADDVALSATASDIRGNAMSMPADGGVRVTRWQWATRVSTTETIRASPALDKDGVVYLGLAGSSSGAMVSVGPDGGLGMPTLGDGPVEGSPAIGRNGSGAEYVFYATGASGGTLKGVLNGVGLAQACAGVGTTAPKATPAILHDGANDVMAVSLQGTSTASGVIALVATANQCRYSTTSGLATINSPGNLVASGDSVYWGDSTGKLRTATYSTSNLNFLVGATKTPWGVGTMNGLLLFDPGTGMEIGGGGGSSGIGRLFAYPSSLSQESLWAADGGYGPTPTSGPILTSSGMVAALQDYTSGTQVQVLRVSPATGQKAAMTSILGGSAFSSTEVPTPVAGEGGLLYVLDDSGLLVVLPQSFGESASPTWTAPAAIAGKTSASPTIDCNRRKPATHTGILYFVTENGWLVSYIVDSKGLDTTAPWPKYAHDIRNTGNPAVAIEACP